MSNVTDVDFQPRRRWHEDQRPLTYVVLEVKTDGGEVRRNSIRSIAAVALNEAGFAIGSFHVNLMALEGTVADPKTLARYRLHGDAWASMTANAQRPSLAIPAFINWVSGLPGQPVAVGSPVSQLALWLETYLRRFSKHVFYRGPFEGELLFAGGALDLPSLVMGVTGLAYRESVEHMLNAEWREGRVETHKPKDDAEMHAALLRSMLKFRALRTTPPLR